MKKQHLLIVLTVFLPVLGKGEVDFLQTAKGQEYYQAQKRVIQDYRCRHHLGPEVRDNDVILAAVIEMEQKEESLKSLKRPLSSPENSPQAKKSLTQRERQAHQFDQLRWSILQAKTKGELPSDQTLVMKITGNPSSLSQELRQAEAALDEHGHRALTQLRSLKRERSFELEKIYKLQLQKLRIDIEELLKGQGFKIQRISGKRNRCWMRTAWLAMFQYLELQTNQREQKIHRFQEALNTLVMVKGNRPDLLAAKEALTRVLNQLAGGEKFKGSFPALERHIEVLNREILLESLETRELYRSILDNEEFGDNDMMAKIWRFFDFEGDIPVLSYRNEVREQLLTPQQWPVFAINVGGHWEIRRR